MAGEQVLRIEPESELKFRGPFTTATTSLLKLTNPTDKRICFKIKTTAPKRYCVRPNAGILEPGVFISIAVVFQPCELEPNANRHKFMVQSMFAPGGDINQDELWKNLDPSKLMETKLRCAFEMPVDTNQQNDLNAVQDDKAIRSKETFSTSSEKPSKDGHDVINKLKDENIILKEEVDRLRRKLKTVLDSSDSMMGNVAPAPAQNMLYVVVAIFIILIGLVLGKFVL